MLKGSWTRFGRAREEVLNLELIKSESVILNVYELITLLDEIITRKNFSRISKLTFGYSSPKNPPLQHCIQ